MEELSEQTTQVNLPETGDLPETEGDAALNSLNRFKSTGELIKAYTNLEKEFTKRSQRLKSLEKEVVDRIPETKEYMKEDWQERVNKFVDSTPATAPFRAEIAKEIIDNGLDNNPNCLELAASRVLLKNYRPPESLAEDEEFLDNHILKNEKIRDRIIKDYLCSVAGTRTVKTIGAGGQPAMSPKPRPQSIGEAGRMMLEMSGRGK